MRRRNRSWTWVVVAPNARACVINPSETKGSPRTALRVSGRDRPHSNPRDRKSAVGRPPVGDGACVYSAGTPASGATAILRSRRFLDFTSLSGLFC